MASKGTVVFRGHSGQDYRFRVWPIGTQFKPLAGVCLFSKRSYSNRNFAQTASHECLHIGQTPDLSRISYDAPHTKGADCVCLYLATDETHRLFVERDLVEQLGVWNTGLHVDLGAHATAARDLARMTPALSTPASET